MSSMHRATTLMMLISASCLASPALGQSPPESDAREWDLARSRLAASHSMTTHQSIDRWRQLIATDQLTFSTYSGFLLTYPGYPQEEKLRGYAEKAMLRESPDPQAVIAYFDRYPPLTSEGAGRYATALAATRRFDATEKAIAAWRSGGLAANAEVTLLSLYRGVLTPADHDARMNELLWQGETAQAERQISFVSPEKRALFMERLALLQGSAPGTLGQTIPPDAMRDGGYVYNRVVQARKSGNLPGAIALLSNRPPLSAPVPEPEKWIKELLTAAKAAGADSAVRIASLVDDGFAPGTDISRQSFRLRDDYTTLMWLGGTKALWSLGDARRAAPLFYRYGAAAQTPGTRCKGFYWAGRALAQSGDVAGANRYFEMAAQYPHYFYGQLSLERLGRPLPDLDTMPQSRPTAAERAAFMAKPIVSAVRDVATDGDWRTTVTFFKEIAEQARSEADHVLVADLARDIGRRDLSVILGQSAHADGYGDFGRIAFPTMTVPANGNWVMAHAVTRQESQFAQNAVSHAGARGLMQLMPGTAREQAGKMGMAYDPASVMNDPLYNVTLGDGYFRRMLDYYGGAVPLAVGAYNAGPGNVNKWLAANGDPRRGGIDWIEWIEKIPIYETKNYVQRVMENAVVYSVMYPGHNYYKGNNPLSTMLGKRTPG